MRRKYKESLRYWLPHSPPPFTLLGDTPPPSLVPLRLFPGRQRFSRTDMTETVRCVWQRGSPNPCADAEATSFRVRRTCRQVSNHVRDTGDGERASVPGERCRPGKRCRPGSVSGRPFTKLVPKTREACLGTFRKG